MGPGWANEAGLFWHGTARRGSNCETGETKHMSRQKSPPKSNIFHCVRVELNFHPENKLYCWMNVDSEAATFWRGLSLGQEGKNSYIYSSMSREDFQLHPPLMWVLWPRVIACFFIFHLLVFGYLPASYSNAIRYPITSPKRAPIIDWN